ncbi:glycosyl hydrolase [Cellulophaga baltica]|uniref:glycoside hydrolase family 2 protein n=1 Tax=Cellulophaga TaxID=104264 RepID=UPI001C06CE63|nr:MULTISPECIES: glycoside hydrolase family 2 TIM barrel-domain containing protein [Cellulophaga]MBU2997086.1 glycosyl hydrolase [Cellulophaga baltica]MDO6768484.1 glycoside hydrolase family 2 TIM barrel-domain containing protein [Cellulophaga sp. 1_MG-2023]
MKKPKLTYLSTLIAFISISIVYAQEQYELNSNWYCNPINETNVDGYEISKKSYPINDWMPATVPGSVLTSLLNNEKVPDPFYGMNNDDIKDIYDTGRDYYTYWFVKDFKEKANKGEKVWLKFRGINYSVDIFINGKKVNKEPYKGMFLRKAFDVTNFLNGNGENRLAVLVHPVDVVGNPNGGQGGDGLIAKNVSSQYVAGWDWIQPIRDRNTGIWDKVFIEKTGVVNIKNPHVVTLVPGVRMPDEDQAPATLKVSTELENTSDKAISGLLEYDLYGINISEEVTLNANSLTEVSLPDFVIENPKLWWPNGYGEQNLYDIDIRFSVKKKVSDHEKVSFGVREIQTEWNEHTRSKQILVNGQKIFIKGGNWIMSDAMLRLSKKRYDAEIRYHSDMNLNLIRIWGGSLTERPEFYEACDKYGMLVIQDFWISGDGNGRWLDPKKREDQWTRRKYPDDHELFITSAEDMVKMIRNHPSLAMWCGGNEITPPADIMDALKEDILPRLDTTRWFIDYSNSDDMSFNFKGGNGDGPYGIQNINVFWNERTWPFNSEVGSVGTGDAVSLKRFLPEENQVVPQEIKGKERVTDKVWSYHKYIGYRDYINAYGKPTDMEDFANKAQLINYDQYRGLMEGFSAHMWDWYTGTIIWKTQNPWTALRGQMYDYYLDPNACLYGTRKGSEPLHVMYNAIKGDVMIVNNTFEPQYDIMLRVTSYDMKGNEKILLQVFCNIEKTSVRLINNLQKKIQPLIVDEGAFISVELLDVDKNIIDDNFYWLPDAEGNYSGLKTLSDTSLNVVAKKKNKTTVEVSITNNKNNTVSFFNRISLLDGKTYDRVMPTFYSDNYISLVPGATKIVNLEYDDLEKINAKVEISGWNMSKEIITIE